jgi:hypothetical protein
VFNHIFPMQGSGDLKSLMMVLASEAEILLLEGPAVAEDDIDAEIDSAIAALSPEEAAAVAEGQVAIANQLNLHYSHYSLQGEN